MAEFDFSYDEKRFFLSDFAVALQFSKRKYRSCVQT